MLYGLIGKSLSHSFSQQYFSAKFKKENIDSTYQLFEIADIQGFTFLKKKYPDLQGLNVTIPYKKEVMPFLDEISEEAQAVGAVNTIKFLQNGKTKGYNTDIYGFQESILAFIPKEMYKIPINVLILGTGGASLAVEYVLKTYFPKWKYAFVSRFSENGNTFLYKNLPQKDLSNFPIIINTTPLGMYPNIETFPDIPYYQLSKKHYIMDLVYNPLETVFLQKSKSQKSNIYNGLKMLHIQAEKAYEIWCM